MYDLQDKLKVVEEREVTVTANEARDQDAERKFLKDQIEQLRSFLRTTGALDESDEKGGGKKGKRGKKGKKKKGGKGKASETRGAAKAN